jgi:hypothetical protein
VLQVDLISQTDIASIAIVGVVLFAIGAILTYLLSQRR